MEDRTSVAIQLEVIEETCLNDTHKRYNEKNIFKIIILQEKGSPEHHMVDAGTKMYLQALKLLWYIGDNEFSEGLNN